MAVKNGPFSPTRSHFERACQPCEADARYGILVSPEVPGEHVTPLELHQARPPGTPLDVRPGACIRAQIFPGGSGSLAWLANETAAGARELITPHDVSTGSHALRSCFIPHTEILDAKKIRVTIPGSRRIRPRRPR